MQVRLAAALFAASLAGCAGGPRPGHEESAPAVTDLDASLEAVRREFNAHRGESRFLTLLSPT